MPTDNYAHSSRRMPKFRMDSVPPGFSRRILAQGNYQDMLQLENRLLKKRYRNPLYHNVCVSFPAVMHSDKWSKLKQSKKMKQRWSDPSRRQKLIEQMKFAWTAVRKQQTSERIKRLCADPEFYKKRCKAMKRISNDPTIKFKASERMKNRYANTIERLKQSKMMISIWSNCTYKSKRIEQMKRDSNTPEHKKKLSENKKRYYADPANRQKQSEIAKKAWQKRKLAALPYASHTEGVVL